MINVPRFQTMNDTVYANEKIDITIQGINIDTVMSLGIKI